MPTPSNQPAFVLAAQLTGRLHRMLKTAQVMRISSSNAKSISIRGGDKTAGFRPITDFISDMAKDTISISSKINQAALLFSNISISEKRARLAYKSFLDAKHKSGSDRAVQLDSLIGVLADRINEYRQQQYDCCKNLDSLIDDIGRRTRATGIIVINSRTEASRAEEYQENLFSVADDLEQCSQSISKDIKACQQYLVSLTSMLGKK